MEFFPRAVYVLSLLQTCRRENFNKYILILTLLSRSTKNCHNKWVLDVHLKVVANKDQSNNIHDICHFEEIMDNLFQERSNIDAFLAALLEFSQFVCFTWGILVSSDKSKSTKIQTIFQGALSISMLLLQKQNKNFENKNILRVEFG